MMVRQRFRGLFQKYLLVLFMAVAIPLAINGVIEAWLGYRDQLARLDQLLGVQVQQPRGARRRLTAPRIPLRPTRTSRERMRA